MLTLEIMEYGRRIILLLSCHQQSVQRQGWLTCTPDKHLMKTDDNSREELDLGQFWLTSKLDEDTRWKRSGREMTGIGSRADSLVGLMKTPDGKDQGGRGQGIGSRADSLVGLMETPDREGAVEAGAHIGDHPLGRALRKLARHEALVGDQLSLHCGRETRRHGKKTVVTDRCHRRSIRRGNALVQGSNSPMYVL